jgi:hypothetical protein
MRKVDILTLRPLCSREDSPVLIGEDARWAQKRSEWMKRKNSTPDKNQILDVQTEAYHFTEIAGQYKQPQCHQHIVTRSVSLLALMVQNRRHDVTGLSTCDHEYIQLTA